MTEVTRLRLRITFHKEGALKYIGHLDLAKIWERVLRRAQIHLAYSQGFNARPKMQFASPLSLGCTSEAELIDVWLEGGSLTPEEITAIAQKLATVSPVGLVIRRTESVPERTPALPTLVRRAHYTATLEAPQPDLTLRVSTLMAQPTILRTRKEKTYDLRPLIVALHAVDDRHLTMILAAQEHAGVGRPDEVLEALGFDPLSAALHRTALELDTSLTTLSPSPALEQE
ncbi:MAG TPA: TIGR03936 family radical SAM-associated protein [Aggregatilineales bacterium]|nr:DUF2344 domain-containing protein [Anaerolineales bacterium]HRE48903.1 TIGR03936 family radical SAM-associated protein [Aggregatilineales bacterium]